MADGFYDGGGQYYHHISKAHKASLKRRMDAPHAPRTIPPPPFYDAGGREVTRTPMQVARLNDPELTERTNRLTADMRGTMGVDPPIKKANSFNNGTILVIDLATRVAPEMIDDAINAYVGGTLRFMRDSDIFEHGFLIFFECVIGGESDHGDRVIPPAIKTKGQRIQYPVTNGRITNYLNMVIRELTARIGAMHQSFRINKFGDLRLKILALDTPNLAARGRIAAGRFIPPARRPIVVRPGFGGTYVKPPPILAKKGAILNPYNTNDDLCFLWASIMALHKDEVMAMAGINRTKIPVHLVRKHLFSINTPEDQVWPMTNDHDSFKAFEDANPEIAWNIMKYTETIDGDATTCVLYVSKWYNSLDYHRKKIVELIFFNNEAEDEHVWHYAAISKMSALVNNTAKNTKAKLFCWSCNGVFLPAAYLKHTRSNNSFCGLIYEPDEQHDSFEVKNQEVQFKPEDEKIAFYNKKFIIGLMPPAAVIYADFECFTRSGPYKNRHDVCGYSYLLRVKKPVFRPTFDKEFEKASKTKRKEILKELLKLCHFESTVQEYRNFKPLVIVRKQNKSDLLSQDFVSDLLDLRKDDSLREILEGKADPAIPEILFREVYGEEGQGIKCQACKHFQTVICNDNYVYDKSSGRVYGYACEGCKEALWRKGVPIPVLFHNGKKYDFHFIIKNLNLKKMDTVRIIGDAQVFKSITFGGFQFLDTIAYLNPGSSLERLMETSKLAHQNGKHDFSLLMQTFVEKYGYDMPAEGFELLMRKGVFPYDWNDSVIKFSYPALPDKAEFRSRMDVTDPEDEDKSVGQISDEEYEHACKVWEYFGMRCFGDYHDLYMGADVMQLADFFESFRKSCWSTYGLEPLCFITGPSLFNAACLKVNKEELDYITNEKIKDMMIGCIRGGVSMITHRKAEIKPEDNTTTIKYWDANNLYGWAMMNKLPIGKFEYKEYNTSAKATGRAITIQQKGGILEKWADPESDESAFLTVDIELKRGNGLENLSAHMDYPLAPVHDSVSFKYLSPYTASFYRPPNDREQDVSDDFETEYLDFTTRRLEHRPTMQDDISAVEQFNEDDDMFNDPEGGLIPRPRYVRSTKLMANLWAKRKYIVHARNLKFYLDHGMVLLAVHEETVFKQKYFMKEYIEINSAGRRTAKQEGDILRVDLFKLANNSVFGKMCEDVRSFKDVKLVSSDSEFFKLARSKRTINSLNIIRAKDDEEEEEEEEDEEGEDEEEEGEEEDKEYDEDAYLAKIVKKKPPKTNLFSVCVDKSKVVFDRPIYIGAAILELAKLKMYQFHYDCVKKVFGTRAKLLMTDTDSLVYRFRGCAEPEKEIINNGLGHYLALGDNVTPGLMKDEYPTSRITGFIGLRAKTYAMRIETTDKAGETKVKSTTKSKGIPGRALNARYDDYRNVLKTGRPIKTFFKRFNSDNHTVTTELASRTGLAAADDKRYIMENGVNTVPYGWFQYEKNIVFDSDDGFSD